MFPIDFKKPYQRSINGKKFVVFSFLCGGFVSLFLIVFQPFGLYEMKIDNKYLIISGFGCVTTFVLLISYIIIELLFNKKKWTLGEQAISIFGRTFFIGIGNGLYAFAIDLKDFTFNNFLWYICVTFAIGIFPVVGLIISDYFKKVKIVNQSKNVKDERILNLIAENGKDSFSIPVNTLLFIQSTDNYCEVNCFDESLEKILIRNTLNDLSKQIPYDNIVRCHRSYIVNLNNIEKCEGNSQGMKITFQNVEKKIKVSRKYVNKIRKLIESNA